MFNSISDEAKRTIMYFGDREVEKTEDIETDLAANLLVTFKEGEPKTELMTEQEFNTGKSDNIMSSPAEKQEAFVRRSVPIALGVQKSLIDFNPRYWEIKKLIQRIEDGIDYAYGQALSVKYGVKNFQTDVNIDTVLKKIEETGVDPLEGLSDKEKAFISFVRSADISIVEIMSGQAFINITERIMGFISKATDILMGVPDKSLRVNDIEKILKEYAAKPKEEPKDEDVPTDNPNGDETAAPVDVPSEEPKGVEPETPVGGEEKPIDGVQV